MGRDGLKERFLTIGDVAETLKVSTRTVWRMIAAGELPKPVKIGAVARVPQSEFERCIERWKRGR